MIDIPTFEAVLTDHDALRRRQHVCLRDTHSG
jgi:hypothetical protein